jgi:hypothetical protein
LKYVMFRCAEWSQRSLLPLERWRRNCERPHGSLG